MIEKDEALRKMGDIKSDDTVISGKITVKAESLDIVVRRSVKEREVRISTRAPDSSRVTPSHIPVK